MARSSRSTRPPHRIGTRDPNAPQFSDHCFTGDYPTRLLDHAEARGAKHLQLSLLSEIEAA